ncbi:tetratricopeptide (TPR) repeat protein [Rhodanobacter sp. K2T2]|uniref:tetratricopeptide repeat-containing sulfotransferase family protein n=1 Tax=Rhodanobacter sp. K2T2 TaxID=2723085 RepID=UPI0015CAE043|nr:sulfotransferase [Rhodanobacter sp. K2T2]NYE28781.1 tetratricopeptide (TPR) repeat protein [Rhodanobacter sp. K2T2]
MTNPDALYSQLTRLFNQREWGAALDMAAELLPLAPRHPGGYYIAGISNLELQRIPQAIECLRRASALEPMRAEYAVQFAKALTVANRNREAKVAADHASSLDSMDHLSLDTLGVIYSQIGSYESAASTFRKVVALAPNHAPYRYNLATALVAAGDIDDAEVELDACLSLNPNYWRAHLTLAQLRRQTPDANHVERLVSLLSGIGQTNSDTSALTCLHLALSKEYEDLACYPEALDHLVRGKTAAGAGRDYSIHRDEAIFAAITDSVQVPVVASGGHATSEPIFIIGMPRSGTTLVERIISSHPYVQSAGELLNFAMSFRHFSNSHSATLIDAEVIQAAADIDWAKLGEMYLSSTRPSTGQKPQFIDKLPHNFLYAGFIAQALPDAKIVCLRRNPMDTCLSNFRQLFAPKSPFFDYSFDLLDVGRYYVLFDRLMAHWQRVLPGRIMEVQYEELVDSQELHSRRLIEFCGLPWDERCLRFEKNPSPIATASAVQVRAPIYRSALNRWKKYGAQLDALQELLENAGVATETS